MDKLECKIVKDLLPLYIDGVCSEESRRMIEEHLAQCADCEKTLRQMQTQVEKPQQQDEGKGALQKIKRKLRKRYLIVIAAAVVLIGLWTGLSVFMQMAETPISYEDIKVSVVQDKKIPTQYNMVFNGQSYAGWYGESELVKEDDKYQYEAEIVHCTSSLWTRIFERKPMKNEVSFSYSSDPQDSVYGTVTDVDGTKKSTKSIRTVAVYYQATPGSPRYLLWVSDDFKKLVYQQIDDLNAVAGEKIIKADQ
ncbi:zf-HC2 domain-containing protein [Anaerovorax odorimutans]|uniref:Anti-sigma-W factor RsiW n=1 Tax=Anaerovorax odorimutans TaxID=109327 RepID=A0ABT1RLS8_9FIRM|nr:zf-HC2 domain-containing protein [Anaerovorax odorimutans]MCQ4636142.1 zf-HC2 domain-containing protein [Anaerovorax odorimutans]